MKERPALSGWSFWWGYRSSKLSLLCMLVKEPPLPPPKAPVWKMKERPALSGHRRCGGFSNPAYRSIHILGPANPSIFSTSIFWRHIWKLFLLINLFSITPTPPPETNTKNPTQSFISTILAQPVLTIWPWSRAVRTLFELSFLWKYSRQLVFVLEEVLPIIGLLIFSAQLVSLGGSRAAHGARIPGVPLLILAPPGHPSNY